MKKRETLLTAAAPQTQEKTGSQKNQTPMRRDNWQSGQGKNFEEE